MGTSRHFWWGITLIVLGVLFLLDNAGMLDAGHLIHTYWPAIFIIWGVSLLVRRTGRSPGQTQSGNTSGQSIAGDTVQNSPADEIHYSTVFGDCTVRASSSSFRGGSVSTVFGDTELDCSAATVDVGEHNLNVHGVFGDIVIRVPQGTAFRLSSSSLAGSVRCNDEHREGFGPSMQWESPGYRSAERRLRIDVSHVFGDVKVSNR